MLLMLAILLGLLPMEGAEEEAVSEFFFSSGEDDAEDGVGDGTGTADVAAEEGGCFGES